LLKFRRWCFSACSSWDRQRVYEEASSAPETAAAALPNNASVYYHLGLTYKQMHDTLRAKQHLEKVLQLDPHFSHAEQVYKALQELVTTG
jgi:tetratricopeptide (TPR) repeat protein